MEPFTQEQLAQMYARGKAFNDEVEADRLRGGNPATVWNEVYDEAGMVFTIWRRKRGGFSCLLVKGMEHCERVIATGVAEPVQEAAHVVPSAETGVEIGRILDRNPNARWIYEKNGNGFWFLTLQ